MRIIDWGMAGVSTSTQVIPKYSLNRPLQFNLPFTTIILGDKFQRTYKNFIDREKKEGNGFTYDNIRYFVLNYFLRFIKDWAGHHQYSEEMFNYIFGEKIDMTLVHADKLSEKTYEKTTAYFHYVSKYIANVLVNFTTDTGSFDREDYFKKVYMHNADVWGLFTAYYPFFIVKSPHFRISAAKRTLFLNALRNIFVGQILESSSKRIDVSKLVADLKKLNTILGVNPSIKVKTPTPPPPVGLRILLAKPATKKRRCPKGTTRDKKSGKCRDKAGNWYASLPTKKKALVKKALVKKAPVKKVKLVLKQKSKTKKLIVVKKVQQTRKRCPKGSRRDKKTGKCKSIATGKTVSV